MRGMAARGANESQDFLRARATIWALHPDEQSTSQPSNRKVEMICGQDNESAAWMVSD